MWITLNRLNVEISILNMWITFVKREVIHMYDVKFAEVFHFVHRDESETLFCGK
jgi:hypothetical protein